MKYVFLIAITTLVLAAAAFAQDEINPIDKKLNACLAVTKGNMPRAECYSTAAEAWEKDIATSYAALIKKLTALGADSAGLKKDIQQAQAAWEKYRDAQFQVFWDEYGKKKGTGYIIPRITMRIDVMKPRAIELENELALYSGN